MLKHDDTIVVGDLHGQVEIAEKILTKTEGHYNVIFLGDYLDSYNRSVEDQIECLKIVLDAVENQGNRVVALAGNHERSYLYAERCSGWNSITQFHVNHLKRKCDMFLREYFWMADDLLITHAGVSVDYVPPYVKNLTLREKVQKFLNSDDRFAVGRTRGGMEEVGGIYWCDYNFEFLPVPGLRQIFGHTRGNSIREKDGNYCIDCLEDSYPAVALVRKDTTIDTMELEELI